MCPQKIMKHTRYILQILALAVALLAAGQAAWASTTKTVTYTLSRSSLSLNLAISGDTPFDGTTAIESQSYFSTSNVTFALADGFTFNIKGVSGSSLEENKSLGFYHTMSSSPLELTVSWDFIDNNSSAHYYVTNVKLTDANDNVMLLEGGGTATTDYNYCEQLLTNNTYQAKRGDGKASTTGLFKKLTITYTDAPDLSVFDKLGDSYLIQSKSDLRRLADYVNKGQHNCEGLTFTQTRDIECDNTFVPIGHKVGSYDQLDFQGTYDGQNHTVSNITVSSSSSGDDGRYIGLFGSIDTGTIKNVVIDYSSFTGYSAVGAIVGNSNSSIVQNCRVGSHVTVYAGTTSAFHIGGVVGGNLYGTIVGCTCAATISNNGWTQTNLFGGIAGYHFAGTIKDCLYTGSTVSANNTKGGIVGDKSGTNTILTNNYYTSVSIGGVAGSDVDGARRARTVTLGEDVMLVGDETTYSLSGLTAIGTTALRSGSTIYSGATQTLTLGYSGNLPAGFDVLYTVTKTSDSSDVTADVLSGTTLTVPNYNINVSAHLMSHPVTVSYIDADGNGQETTALPLTGSETELGIDGQATWYIANSNISYNRQLTLNGDVHLILGDGHTMDMTQTGSQYCIQGSGKNLTLYGQDSGTGALTMNSGGYGILARALVINGGHITASSTNHTFVVEYDLTINGGVVKATSSDSSSGFFSSNEGSDKICLVTINGGQVETNRISCLNLESGDTPCRILLDYRNPDDYIKVGDYQIPVVWIADGKVMKDGDQYFAGQYILVDEATRLMLSNTQLQPVMPVSTDYLDANGITRTVMAIPLPESQPIFNFAFNFWRPPLWFVVNSNISYAQNITFNTYTHIILADNCKLTITGDINSTLDLSIYGQSGGTGALEAEGSSNILAKKVMTINGGHITTSGNLGSNQSDFIIINGGVVSVTQSISSGYSVTINGGQVSANTIYSRNTTILGYRDKDHDSIYSRSYSSSSTITIADGQVMTDGTNTYSGTVSRSDVGNKTLRPAGVTPSYDLKLAQGTKDGVTAWWGTYYHGTVDITLPEGATAYTMGADYKLYRLGTDGRTIPKGKAVVIIATVATPVDPATSPATATIPLTPVGTGIPSVTDHAPGGNILQGSNNPVNNLTYYPYVLSIVNNDPATIGFHEFLIDNGSFIPAHKAYYLQ